MSHHSHPMKRTIPMNRIYIIQRLAVCALLCITAFRGSHAAAGDGSNRWFNTLVAHWTDYGTPEYLDFLAEAKPEIAQVGFYGVTFYSVAHTPFGKGYPAHFPVQGTKECSDWFARLNREVHARGVRVVGHFNMTFILGDPEKKAGFFEWYDKGWDEATFGPKPCVDPVEMLQKDAAGKLIATHSYKIGGWPEYHGCLNNPKWRACLKAMAKSAIERGVDGLIANYFYRRDCMCEFCVAGFRKHLDAGFSAAELRERFGIADIKTHQFTEIHSWHDPKQTNPFRMASLRWSQIALKEAFDDVLLRYGRSLKPDLMIAQWNHLGGLHAISGDERCALPGEMWGRGEDYLWYSTGAAACQTDLAKGDLGDGTLQLRYIRGAFGPKPFVLGKYEQTRMRATVAEGIANGGGAMGFYARFNEPSGREALSSYFRFTREHRDFYEGAQPAAELLLLFPRSAIHAGELAPLERFRVLGRRLIREGYAFDIVPDDLLSAESLRGRTALAWCDAAALTPGAKQALDDFKGSRMAVLDEKLPESASDWSGKLARVSHREGSPTVVISKLEKSAGKRWFVHLVNYNREEPPAGAPRTGRGSQDEKPLRVEKIRVTLPLPEGARVKAVRLFSPDPDVSTGALPFEQSGGAAHFTVPAMLVYSVAEIEIE